MLSFKKITIEDMPVLKRFSRDFPNRQCERSAGSAVMWADSYCNSYAVWDDTIIFTAELNGKVSFSHPIGKNIDGMFDEIEKHCREAGIPLSFISVNSSELPHVLERYPDSEHSADRDWFDYIYEKDALMNLVGNKYSGPRNHINKFRRLYENWSFEKITEENLPEIIEFMNGFAFHGQKDDEEAAETEIRLCKEVLENYAAYDMLGGALRVDGKIIGYSIGEAVGDTLIVHIEKADTSYQGAYQMVTNQFLRLYADESIKFVNREDDTGDEGLRRSKLSYHPVELLEKHYVKVNNF